MTVRLVAPPFENDFSAVLSQYDTRVDETFMG